MGLNVSGKLLHTIYDMKYVIFNNSEESNYLLKTSQFKNK